MKILNNKPIVYDDETQRYIVDLTASSYQPGIEFISPVKYGYVIGQMTMRPDLFAGVYSTSEDDQYDILKYNRISNPFTLNEGDILGIPNMSQMNTLSMDDNKRTLLNKDSIESKNTLRDKILDVLNPFDKNNVSTNSFESFKQKYKNLEEQKKLEKLKDVQNQDGQNASGDLLPPNFSDKNKKEFTITPNGTVVLGTSVAETETTCGDKNISKAELYNSLIKNRVIK